MANNLMRSRPVRPVNATYCHTDKLVQLTAGLPQKEFAQLEQLSRSRNLARSVVVRELLVKALGDLERTNK
jgi:hypothetical protein